MYSSNIFCILPHYVISKELVDILIVFSNIRVHSNTKNSFIFSIKIFIYSKLRHHNINLFDKSFEYQYIVLGMTVLIKRNNLHIN